MAKYDLKQYKGEGKANLRVLNRIKNGEPYFYSYASDDLASFLDKLNDAGIGKWDVGNMSKKGGGKIPYSSSHCTGQDVDIAIPLINGSTSLKNATIDLGTKGVDNDAFLPIDPTGKSKSTKESSEDGKDIEYGYSFSKINEEDGSLENISSENANQAFYGASIQKPVIALVALIAGEKLTDDFLDRLILYTAKSGNGSRRKGKLTGSNGANQILKEKYQASSKMQNAAKELAEGLGIKDTFNIIRGLGGNNEQSAQAYSKFLAAIENYENHPYLKNHSEAAEKIRSRIRLASSDTTKGSGRGDYEGPKLKNIVDKANEYLQDDNRIAKVYGKGGYTSYKDKGTPLARNVSLVVELDNGEKFIFTMYVNSRKGIKPNKGKEGLNELIAKKLAEAIKKIGQGLNESLNEQESGNGNEMDSERAYNLVKFSKENGAKIIFLGGGLIDQITDWAKENNKDMGVLSKLFKEEEHYDHFHIRLENGVKGCPDEDDKDAGDDSKEKKDSGFKLPKIPSWEDLTKKTGLGTLTRLPEKMVIETPAKDFDDGKPTGTDWLNQLCDALMQDKEMTIWFVSWLKATQGGDSNKVYNETANYATSDRSDSSLPSGPTFTTLTEFAKHWFKAGKEGGRGQYLDWRKNRQFVPGSALKESIKKPKIRIIIGERKCK